VDECKPVGDGAAAGVHVPGAATRAARRVRHRRVGRGLHSSTFLLKLSRFCH